MNDNRQSESEAINKLREASSVFFDEIVKALRIDKFVEWLSIKLNRLL